MEMFSIAMVAWGVVVTWAVMRRYRRPLYTTQRYSRMAPDGERKSTVPPLKVPWTVAYPAYSPVWVGPAVAASGGCDRCWWWYLTYIDGRCRLLCEVSPSVLSALPLNPYGRTGYVGRGLLPRVGGNLLVFTVLRFPNGGLVAMPHPGSLPQRPPPVLSGTLCYRGYIDHPYNTDNAWVEASIYVVDAIGDPGVEQDEDSRLCDVLERVRLGG